MNARKSKNTILNLFLLALLLLVFLFGIEFFVRVLYKNSTVLFPRYHTDAQYGDYTLRKIRPNSVFWHTSRDGKWKFSTNQQGFRNYKDFNYEKTPGTIRILSLGDSHTQGYEVRQDYTFSAIMEKHLNLQGYKAEVINAGVSGFSTAEELLFLENEGIKYKPDFVVVGFYANDFQDNIKSKLFKLNDNGELEIQGKEHIPGVNIQNIIYSIPLVKWLSENSYFYSLLFNNTWKFFKTKLSKTASDNTIEYAISTQDKYTEYQTTLASALLKRMHDFCQKNRIQLIVIDIPQIKNKSSIKTSFSEELSKNIGNYSDAYISSETILSDYAGIAEMHRPHGHRHITEFTHILLGVNAAKEVISLRQ